MKTNPNGLTGLLLEWCKPAVLNVVTRQHALDGLVAFLEQRRLELSTAQIVVLNLDNQLSRYYLL